MPPQEVLLMAEQTNYQTPPDPDVAVQINMATLTWETEDEADNGIRYVTFFFHYNYESENIGGNITFLLEFSE